MLRSVTDRHVDGFCLSKLSELSKTPSLPIIFHSHGALEQMSCRTELLESQTKNCAPSYTSVLIISRPPFLQRRRLHGCTLLGGLIVVMIETCEAGGGVLKFFARYIYQNGHLHQKIGR
ncbi:hypothetical protein BDU57DRAFT_235521 [Ampelomyces quisqualis]|uniref:Uncharacterized protein n=1 Tax=Ampelomyces quisqualis TaxID=50730 RepID=A0A6A5QM57_AMPQU|nr:hypothetical protein BDU57DRAFT_235521 [Ampelomyces quisqualis]